MSIGIDMFNKPCQVLSIKRSKERGPDYMNKIIIYNPRRYRESMKCQKNRKSQEQLWRIYKECDI